MMQGLTPIFLLFLMIHTGKPARGSTVCKEQEVCITLQLCSRHHARGRILVKLRTCGTDLRAVCCPPYVNGTAVSSGASSSSSTLLPSSACGRSGDGMLTSNFEAFPWMALLAYRKKATSQELEFLCGGTLISSRYVLTAGHCMKIPKAKLPVSVRLGIGDRELEPHCAETRDCVGWALDVNVEEIILHGKFNKPVTKNDIALIRLAKVVVFTQHIQPICLQFDTISEARKFEVAGWTHNGRNMSQILQHSRIPGVNTAECNAKQVARVRPIDQSQICAGGVRGYNVCRGQSGGPMMVVQIDDKGYMRVYQVGIVSFGTYPCGSDVPSVFTRVSAFRNWILVKMTP